MVQPRQRFVLFLIRHPAKILLPLVSLLLGSGWPGILFGLILGYFFDSLLRQLRLGKQARAFFEDPHNYRGPYPLLNAVSGLTEMILRMADERNQQNGHFYKDFAANAIRSWPEWKAAEQMQVEPIMTAAQNCGGTLDDLKHYCGLLKNSDRIASHVILQRLEQMAREFGLPRNNPLLEQMAREWGCQRAEKELSRGKPDLSREYAVLGLDESADIREIKRVYHALAAQFHPDRCRDLSLRQREQCDEAFLRIRDAYEKILLSFDAGA